MGYQRPTLKLQFADEEMAGLEVKARRLTIEGVTSLQRLATRVGDILQRDVESDGDAEDLDHFYATLAAALISWNLEEPGPHEGNPAVPVPCAAQGLRSQDLRFVLGISSAVMEASASVPAPLPAPSSNGARSPEVSIPMEPLSASPPS